MEQNFLTIFLGPQDTLEASRGGQKGHGCPQARRARHSPAKLVPPLGTSNPKFSSINTYFSTATSFCLHEILSGDLFRYSAGGGCDQRELLHQPCCHADDL